MYTAGQQTGWSVLPRLVDAQPAAYPTYTSVEQAYEKARDFYVRGNLTGAIGFLEGWLNYNSSRPSFAYSAVGKASLELKEALKTRPTAEKSELIRTALARLRGQAWREEELKGGETIAQKEEKRGVLAAEIKNLLQYIRGEADWYFQSSISAMIDRFVDETFVRQENSEEGYYLPNIAGTYQKAVGLVSDAERLFKQGSFKSAQKALGESYELIAKVHLRSRNARFDAVYVPAETGCWISLAYFTMGFSALTIEALTTMRILPATVGTMSEGMGYTAAVYGIYEMIDWLTPSQFPDSQ